MAIGKQGGHKPAPTSKPIIGKGTPGSVIKGGGVAKGKMPKSTSASGVKAH